MSQTLRIGFGVTLMLIYKTYMLGFGRCQRVTRTHGGGGERRLRRIDEDARHALVVKNGVRLALRRE